MMAALLQKLLGDEYLVESAGIRVETARPANAHSILCMKEREIDLSGHRSRWIGDTNISQFSHFVCVHENVEDVVRRVARINGAMFLTANKDCGGIPDPYGKGLPAYRECLDLLDKVLPDIAKQIRGC